MQCTHPISPQPFSEQPSKLEDLKSLDAILATIKKEKYSRAVEQFNFFMAFLPPHAEKEVLKKIFDCLLLLVPVVESPKEIEEGVRLLLNLASDAYFAEEQKQLAIELAKWHYKQGKQERLNKKQFKDPINALHYAVKAQSISMDSTESQRQASRYFKVASTSLSVFKQRLKKARAEDKNQEVVQLITNLETRFKAICCKDEQHALIKLFYKQVRKLIAALFSKRGGQKPIEASGLHHLKPTMDRYLNSKSLPTACFITTTYREKLKAYRENFRALYQIIDLQKFTIEEVRALQKKVSTDLIELLHALIDDAIAILGDPPCSYDLRAMGSLAKEEICPYSDLEWCILIEAIEHRPYFVKLARLLELQIISLGEDPAQGLPVFTCIGAKHRSGFHIDSGGNPAIVTDLINTPDGLAQMQKMKEYSSTSPSNTLRKTISFHQNTSVLFVLYQKKMSVYLDEVLLQAKEIRRKSQALQLLADRLKAYEEIWHDPFKCQIIDLKKHYSELLHHLLNDLSLYFGMKESNTLDLIDALVKEKIFTVESGFLLQEAVAAVYLKRVGLHFKHKEQKEEVSLENPLSEQEVLTKIYWLVLRSLYRKLKLCLSDLDSHQFNSGILKLDTDFQHIDLLLLSDACYGEKMHPNAIENLKSWIIHFVHHLVSRQQANALAPDQQARRKHEAYYQKRHEACYQRLSRITFTEPLRETYLKVLNRYSAEENLAALSAHLASIPNPSGVRQSQRLEEEQLQQAILAMTTDQSNDEDTFQVKIRCPAVPVAKYLRQDVCEQILGETGDLKKQYESRHHVATASYGEYQLHFKQKPTHPLLEYAIHALTARIAGHLSPPTELARFEVEVKGKKRIYPVLISKTIQGQTLQNENQLDVKQLTWAYLCAILTRPGDGRFSNYVVEEKTQRIFCVDNDVSFVEPVMHHKFGHKVHFSSALFCLHAEYRLDAEVVQAFLDLDPNLILKSWLDDLIQKDEAYRALQLFTPKEEKRLYEEDREDRFKGKLLLRSGTVANLLVQFYHLQDCLRQALKDKKRLAPIDLLPYLVNLRGSQKQSLDRWVHPKYREVNGNSLSPKQRLQQAIDRQVDKSLTSAQADAASFGKPPTFEEFYQREEYSPEKAKRELLAFTLSRYTPNVEFGTSEEGEWIEADFKKMVKEKTPDRERQRFVLHALIFLMNNKDPKPRKITLMNCAALDKDMLKPFLHIDLDYLNVSGCPLIKLETIQEIEKCSPNLKSLYLNRCAKLRAFEKTNYFTPICLQFAKLEELQLKRCRALVSIQLDAPLLHTLKADNNPHLKTLFFKTMAPYVKGSFTNCLALDLKKATGEGLGRILKEIKNLEIHSKLLLQIYMNDPKFEAVELSHQKINDKETEVLAQALAFNATLKTLRLDNNQISDKGMKALTQALASNTNFELLSLNKNQISDKGMEAFAKTLASNTALESLYLDNNQISDKGMEAFAKTLASNTTLRELFLNGNQISDKGMEALAKTLASNTTALKSLYLNNNQISDEGMEAFAKTLDSNTTLRELSLNGNRISDKGMKALAQALASNTALKSLYLDNNQISDEGMEAFAKTLASNTTLRVLSLNGNQISDKRMKAFARSLASNTALDTLYLDNNQISNGGMEAFAKTLASNIVLKALSLNGNQISGKRMEAFARNLASNTTLRALRLDNNQISDEGMEVFAKTLASNTNLRVLSLNGNQISDEGMEAFAKTLASNTTLRVLSLNGNQISDKGMKTLAQTLVSNKVLESLFLDDNQISDEGMEALAQALASNTSLKELLLKGKQISDNGKKAFAQTLASNMTLNIYFRFNGKGIIKNYSGS